MTISGHLNFAKLETLIYGSGTVEAQLRPILRQHRFTRVFVLSTPSLVRNGLYQKVLDILGDICCGSFPHSAEHTPSKLVIEAATQARAAGADCLLSLGGSSVVDLGKGVSLVLAEGENLADHRIQFSAETGLVIPPLLHPKLPQIVIPTTLSASEYTPGVGITDEEHKEKRMYADTKLTPKIVFHDPSFCASTPDALWASTGMKILADCFERLTAKNAQAFTNLYAKEALRILLEKLPLSIGKNADPQAKQAQAKQDCLYAGFLIMSLGGNTTLGLIAAIRHQLGGNQGVGHGDASTIVLPHVLRWNLSETMPIMANLAREIEVSTASDDEEAAQSLIALVEKMIADLSIPARLRDVGVKKDSFAEVAAHVLADFSSAGNARTATRPEHVFEILEAAY